MRKAEWCSWVCKAKQSSSLAERSGLAERRLGGVERLGRAEWLGGAERRLGRAERERQRSFMEQQSFWVFPLQLPPFQNCIDLMQMVEVE